jgi:hypothetical protein
MALMDLATYRRNFEQESAPGWDCISMRLSEVYGGQEPKHFATSLPMVLGGKDPLDGVSVYRSSAGSANHFHLVTYGLSELYYSEESVGGEFSKFGFELTLRLMPCDSQDGEPYWAIDMLQNLARYVFSSGRWFEPFHCLPANGPIRLGADTLVTALATIQDPELGSVTTPHGLVHFIQLLGITQHEYELIRDRKIECSAFMGLEKCRNPLYITRLDRADS